MGRFITRCNLGNGKCNIKIFDTYHEVIAHVVSTGDKCAFIFDRETYTSYKLEEFISVFV